MKYFTLKFIKFFKDLSKNNNKTWFDENRKIYEEEVKKPFMYLIEDLIPFVQSLDSDIRMLPKEAIFRINRDLRFSRDKTPYKTMVKAAFARGGRSSLYPGFYLGISAEGIYVGGGKFKTETKGLNKIRDHINENANELIELSSGKNFKEFFGSIQGDKLKRIPKKYKETHAKTDLIANKKFYAMAHKNASLITSEKLLPQIMKYFEVIMPLNQYIKKAMH